MTGGYIRNGHIRRVVTALWKLLRIAAMAIGFVVIAGTLIGRVLRPVFYVDEVVEQVRSQDQAVVAKVVVTKGGLGTVWTTRVRLEAPHGTWTIYETRDSDFTPLLRWTGSRELLVRLPCDRFGHLSNPDDWVSAKPRPDRIRVRFTYQRRCPEEPAA